MTVEARDLSNYGGEPITLYEFSRRSKPTLTGIEVVTVWRYTSADRDYTFGGHVYAAIPISDDGVRQSGNSNSDQLTIIMPASSKIPQMFVGSPPSDPINALIRRTHRGETDSFLAWVGVIGGVTRNDEIASSVVCNTIGATLDRSGLRLAYSRHCPHDLYGFECRADPTLHYAGDSIAGLTGDTIQATGFGTFESGELDGGWVEWIDEDGHAERRAIVNHDTVVVRIMGSTDRLIVGMTVYAFKGCDRTKPTCISRFDNLLNHGGHDYMPDNSPFSGDLIF